MGDVSLYGKLQWPLRQFRLYGLPSSAVSNCPSRDHATGAIWLSDVRCRGNESSLDQCPSSGWGRVEFHCRGHTSDACLVCYDPLYHNSEITVQLSGSEVPYAGRVKVRYQGVWGTLCGDDWKHHQTAEVLCRHLGYKGVELDFTLYNQREYFVNEVYDSAGPGPVWFNGDGCSGHEKTLSECNLRQERHCLSDDNLELICKVENVSANEFSVRLHGGNHSNEGRVEVFYGGLWGTVSTKKWDLTDAMVLCRQLGFTKAHSTYSKNAQNKRVIWFSGFECQGNEPTLGQCKHSLLARPSILTRSLLKFLCVVEMTRKANQVRQQLVSTSSGPPHSNNCNPAYQRTAIITNKTVTCHDIFNRGAKHWGACTYSDFKYSRTFSTSAPSTVAPPSKCPSTRCQNGGTCERVKNAWKCYCLGMFAGEYCAVYVGSNAVSIVLKMTLDQWKPDEFKRTLAEILTSHCRLNLCLYEIQNTKARNQKKPPSFQPDDVIILQGYPKAWQGMSLLNVTLAVKMPDDSSNTVIPHDILSQLIMKVAPEVHRRLGHGIAYIDRVEVVASATPEASGRNADEPHSTTVNKYALIVLGVLLGLCV
ncbi:Neurotrypsin [Desmophyllum pertusum]|uniref:Neurotrypsin n=1 Tax=Desmophyllum pertusum TaxID=174260 RepID=A0A9X0CV33_9CNID|nr:Neurotrypsin [Desmophyllum pertusum]